jgi:hypothetical protein
MQKIWAAISEAAAAGEIVSVSYGEGKLTVIFAQAETEMPKPKRSYARKPKAKTPVTLSSIAPPEDLEIPEALRR